ncbi:hypothetical protein ALC53_12088 [Atta colombica]|uniref:Uncharacterized protein n=1 Tax=Atta colombica TaxID=520822 RepID=A0A195AZS2_9HYME|nr:hypothetical protein ALC53_12088 [Atta colombica]
MKESECSNRSILFCYLEEQKRGRLDKGNREMKRTMDEIKTKNDPPLDILSKSRRES